MPDQQTPRTASRWAGLPQASRRAQRRTLLLDTAFELLASEGETGMSVRAVCQAARLNPRYFYESFESLDELLVTVYDRVVEELAAAVTLALVNAPADVGSQVRATIDTILEFVDEDRRRGQIVYVVALGNEKLNNRRLETGRHLVE
ncbi:MAG: TetR/AcrR family transcriptional regulator, partial [Acidimicrobiia bacterium]|nr:TetR/AcrR family transcriptional regulator [Acidimicrobiia bacterium]